MYYEWYKKYRQPILVAIVGLAILFTGWAIFNYVTRIGKVGVTISAVPYSARVTINGQSSGSGVVWLTPGTYTVKASSDGFSSREKRIEVTEKKKQNVVSLALSPQSDSAKKWAEAHQQDYKNNEFYGAIEAQENGKIFSDKHPVVKVLPYNDPYFQLDYRQDKDSDQITLTISTSSPRYRYFAIQKLRQLGYDPTDYKIDFKDFKNPLEQIHE
jgi:uncharacterized membrane protein